MHEPKVDELATLRARLREVEAERDGAVADTNKKLTASLARVARLEHHLKTMLDAVDAGPVPACDCRACGDCSDAFWRATAVLEARAALAAQAADHDTRASTPKEGA
jgi:hypothetical protein